MRRLVVLSIPTLALLLAPTLSEAAPWVQAPTATFNDTAQHWSTKVELADIDGNGWVDILFANVGGYQAGTEDSYLPNQAFMNMDGTFVDMSIDVFGPDVNDPNSPSLDTGRVIKAYDFDGDGNLDIFVGTTWLTPSRLYMGEGGGVFTEVSDTNLPQTVHSIGDAEVADVDGDGDFDIMITDWGEAPVGQVGSKGAVTRLWINDGGGAFTDATDGAMPQINVNWSWELEFIDVDNDWDVDVLISCRSCLSGGFLFENDGGGTFVNATPGNLPQKVGSVDYEVMDLNGDDYVDVVTLGDGDGGGEGFRNRVLINNKNGGFTDESADYWPPLENSPSYDYMGAFLDPNSDRKPDLIVGAFSDWPNRLMTFSGTSFSGDPDPWPLVNTDGTYALAVADVNNDTKIDVVMAQGENFNKNRLFLGDEAAEDTAKPVIQNHVFEGMWTIGETINIHARIHDNKSPNKDHDWTEVVFEYALNDDDIEVNAMTAPLAWYGEYLWRGDFEVPNADKIKYRICAEDAAHNRECTPVQETMIEDPNETESATESMTDSNTDSMTVTDSNTDSMTATDSMTDSASASASASATASDSASATESDSASATATDSASATATDSASATESASATASDSATASATDSDSDSATTGGFMLDDDGCGCNATNPSNGALTGLGLLALLGLRRRRRQ